MTIDYDPVPTADVTPAGGLSFGPQAPGTTSPSQQVTVTNNGSAPLDVAGATLEGTNAAEFSVDSACGAGVPVGGSCSMFVRFTPAGAGTRTATLAIASNAPSSPERLVLVGDGGPSATGVTGGTPVSTPTAPVLSALSMSPSTFRAARARASQRRPPVGTTITFTLDKGARMRFTVLRRRRNVRLGRFTVEARPGINRVRFNGRVRRRALRPGRYRLRAVPIAGTLTGSARTVRFRIVR